MVFVSIYLALMLAIFQWLLDANSKNVAWTRLEYHDHIDTYCTDIQAEIALLEDRGLSFDDPGLKEYQTEPNDDQVLSLDSQRLKKEQH